MVFSSTTFLLAFLPLAAILYYICPRRLRNALLLVKDSFANAFVPFLTGDYETITMIDLRYYRDSMQSLADESTDILVLTEMSNLAASGDYFKLSR